MKNCYEAKQKMDLRRVRKEEWVKSDMFSWRLIRWIFLIFIVKRIRNEAVEFTKKIRTIPYRQCAPLTAYLVRRYGIAWIFGKSAPFLILFTMVHTSNVLLKMDLTKCKWCLSALLYKLAAWSQVANLNAATTFSFTKVNQSSTCLLNSKRNGGGMNWLWVSKMLLSSEHWFSWETG